MKLPFTLLVFLLGFFGCHAEEPCTNFSLGEPVEIYLGETISHCEENISITFVELISDSRCPANANCIWQGMIEVKIAVAIEGKESTFQLSSEPNYGSKLPRTQELEGYQITLENAIPYPVIGQKVNDKDRIVVVSIQKVEE